MEPLIAKVGDVVQSSPTAVSHQSLSQVHSKDYIHSLVAPAIKSTQVITPVVRTVHAAPLLHQTLPIVKSIHHASPIVQTYAAAPIVQTYAASPIVHSVPTVYSSPFYKTLAPAAPIAYTLHH